MTNPFSSLPLHPMLVHFPIALFITAMVLESLSWILKKKFLHEAAKTIFVFAAFVSPLTVWAGLADEKRLGLHHPVVEAHERLGLMTMWAGLACVLILAVLQYSKIKHPPWIFFLMTVLLVGLVSWTAFYGGEMVYEYGVGVAAQ